MLEHRAVENAAAPAGVSQERRLAAFRPLAAGLRPVGRFVPEPRLPVPALPLTDRPTSEGALPLPLYHRPGSVVLLDDQPDQLERLAPLLPPHWNVVTFASPQSCLNYLQQEPPRWEADCWAQRRIVDDWYDNRPLIPRILAYWADHPERNSLTRVFVCDDLMPGMDGLDLLGELVDWPGYRVLLDSSGQDEHLADARFRGLFDRSLPKQAGDFVSALTDAVNGLLGVPCERAHRIWSRTFSVDQARLLRTPAVAQDLCHFARRTWVEWVAIGEPFGMLGIDACGVISWLQLETTGELAVLAQAAAGHGATPAEQEDIRRGRAISDYKLQKCLGRGQSASVLPAFYVGDGGQLLAAIRRIDSLPRR